MSQKKPELLPMAESICCAPRPQSTVSCCGGPGPRIKYSDNAPWIVGSVKTPVGEIPQLSTRLTRRDLLGHWKVRWAIGRMRYAVAPGLRHVVVEMKVI